VFVGEDGLSLNRPKASDDGSPAGDAQS